MIDERQLELINADLDGELRPEQRAELARLLLADPEARAMHEELARLSTTLAGLESVPPPPGLAPAVLAALPPTRPRALTAVRVRHTFGSMGMRYAAVFIGGLLASLALLRLAPQDSDGLAVPQLVGTIGGSEPGTGQEPIDRAVLALAEVEGTMNTYLLGSQLVLELDLRARQPVELVAVHGAQEVRFTFGSPAGAPERVLWLPTARSGSDVAVRVYSGGQLRHEAELGAARPSRSE